jgi:septum formation protein
MILASKSPRRKEILENIGINIEIDIPDIEEISSKEIIKEKIEDIAYKKCMKIAEKRKLEYIVAADTVVVIDNEILGKPVSEKSAKEMLLKLSGREHEVITGFCMINIEKKIFINSSEITKVKFKKITEEEIEWYISTKESFDKAGGYGVQGNGAVLVEGIIGDFFNVMGFPLHKFLRETEEKTGFTIKDILKL